MDRQEVHTGSGEPRWVEGIVAPERRGPREGESAIGVDRARELRPGVPEATEPRDVEAVAGRPLTQQRVQRQGRLHRLELEEPTPVFGTAQPHRGPSGALRAVAYRTPEHQARHWMLLMLADRVNAAEEFLTGGFLRTGEGPPLRRVGRGVRHHPVLAAGVVLGAVLLGRRLRA